MKSKVSRQTVDLTAYPDLAVIYLGMRANSLRGFKTLFSLGPEIQGSVAAKPDGLLLHENLVFGIFPPHVGMRQYWRDFESLEKWIHVLPHQRWWQNFLRDTGGTGFWHELYLRRGGMEGIYLELPVKVGFGKFAPAMTPRGSMFSALKRAGREGEPKIAVPESELYD